LTDFFYSVQIIYLESTIFVQVPGIKRDNTLIKKNQHSLYPRSCVCAFLPCFDCLFLYNTKCQFLQLH